MPPGLPASRSSRCVACLVMAVGVALGPPAWAHADDGAAASTSRPTASPSAEDSPLAGRQAGEGRARPGRSLSPLEAGRSKAAADEVPPDPDPAKVPAFTPPPEAFPDPGETARQRQAVDAPGLKQVRDVSLGSGIALVGLGLAFLALRMRRAN
uniref:Tat pathway signal sequence domain protein n=1 Tax=Streptomyces sp. NBC_01401 TaxID=2903854 RepID=A0AAU3GW69_9ACTN